MYVYVCIYIYIYMIKPQPLFYETYLFSPALTQGTGCILDIRTPDIFWRSALVVTLRRNWIVRGSADTFGTTELSIFLKRRLSSQ